MPAPDIILPGFYGKIPATGDFVTRQLRPEFVRAWDPWVARHLVPFVSSGDWVEEEALFFLTGPDFLGPMAGVVVPSSDRAGRRFPLTLAAPVPVADTGLISAGLDWFLDLQDAARVAQRGEVAADDLAVLLDRLPFPPIDEAGHPVSAMCCWTDLNDLVEVDPALPGPALAWLFHEQRKQVG